MLCYVMHRIRCDPAILVPRVSNSLAQRDDVDQRAMRALCRDRIGVRVRVWSEAGPGFRVLGFLWVRPSLGLEMRWYLRIARPARP